MTSANVRSIIDIISSCLFANYLLKNQILK
nr:MAG TPA: hypothetical protein [Caudoviricetes sp.]